MKIPVANPKISAECKETYFHTSQRLYFMSCQFAYRQRKALWLNTDTGIKCQLIAISSHKCFCPYSLMKKDYFKIRALKRKKKVKKEKRKRTTKKSQCCTELKHPIMLCPGLNFKCYCHHYFLSHNFFQWLLDIYDICQMYRKTKRVTGRSSSLSCRHNKAHLSNIIEKPVNKANQASSGNEA